MKYFLGLVFIIWISFGTTSCQKEFTIGPVDSSLISQPPSSGSGSFIATIDGAKFIADKAVGAVKAAGVIAITGQSLDGENIVLRVADSAVHSYAMDIGSFTNFGGYSKDTGYAYATNQGNTAAESGGTLNITSIDTVNKTISGTFSMKVYRQFDKKQKNITEGIFTNIPYETTALPPANAKDTFRVKVDGKDFSAESISGNAFYGRITLSASDQMVHKTIGITVPDNISEGTYSMGGLNSDYIGQYNIGTTTLMTASGGKLTILEHNTTTKRIRGSFNFTAKEMLGTSSAEITEGYFSVVYQ